MKRIIFSKIFTLCLSIFFIQNMSLGQTELYVDYYIDKQDAFYISDEGKLYFDQSNLIIDEGNGFSTNISISDLKKITFANNDVSIVEINNLDKYATIYPNPGMDYINVKTGHNNQALFSIYSLSGKLLLQQTVYSDEKIDISFLASGMYIIKIDGNTIKFSKL